MRVAPIVNDKRMRHRVSFARAYVRCIWDRLPGQRSPPRGGYPQVPYGKCDHSHVKQVHIARRHPLA